MFVSVLVMLVIFLNLDVPAVDHSARARDFLMLLDTATRQVPHKAGRCPDLQLQHWVPLPFLVAVPGGLLEALLSNAKTSTSRANASATPRAGLAARELVVLFDSAPAIH